MSQMFHSLPSFTLELKKWLGNDFNIIEQVQLNETNYY